MTRGLVLRRCEAVSVILDDLVIHWSKRLSLPTRLVQIFEVGPCTACALVRLDTATISDTIVEHSRDCCVPRRLLVWSIFVSTLLAVLEARGVPPFINTVLVKRLGLTMHVVAILQLCLLWNQVRRLGSQHVPAVTLDHLLVVVFVKDLLGVVPKVAHVFCVLRFSCALPLPLVRRPSNMTSIHAALRSTVLVCSRSVIGELLGPCEPSWVMAVVHGFFIWALSVVTGDFLSPRRCCLLLVNP